MNLNQNLNTNLDPYKVNQLLVLPDGKIGRFSHVEESDSQPADPESGTRAYDFLLLAVESHGKTVYVEIQDVVAVDEYQSADE